MATAIAPEVSLQDKAPLLSQHLNERYDKGTAAKNSSIDEEKRAAYLLKAQRKAIALFEKIEKHIIRSGVSEKTLSDEIHDFGAKRHEVRTHWHKRTVRSGLNTLLPYKENPNRTVQPGDILFVNTGPVFEA